MGDVQFEEPQYTPAASPPTEPKGLAGLVIRCGFARDTAGAQKVLLVVLVLLVLVIVGVFMFSGRPIPPAQTPADSSWPR